MSKTLVTRLFVGGVVIVVAGAALALVGTLAAVADGGVVIGGPDVVAVNGGALAGPVITVIVGSLAIAAGAVATVISWFGALVNVAHLEDKTWFAVLLILGLFSFGFVAMVAYVVAGPDGTSRATRSAGAAETLA